MATVVPYIPSSHDLAQLDPMQKMYIGFMAQYLDSPKTYHAYEADLKVFGTYCAERNLNPLNGSSYQYEGGYRVLRFVGKGGKARTVKVPVPAMAPIEAAIADRGPDAPILINHAGRRLTRVNGDRMVKRLAAAAGVNSDISNHSLRRSLVTTGKSSGLDYEDLAQILGHANISTTAVYDKHAGSIHRNKVDQITGYLADLAS